MKTHQWQAACLSVVIVILSLSPEASGQFIQQGKKLRGTDAVGEAEQGLRVSISGDGNTAVVGGPGDAGHIGAAWVFGRERGVWSQQGFKLVGSGAVNPAVQANSVAISKDGSTIVLGGPGDDDNTGAVWVFIRSGGVWVQQGSKLVGSGSTYRAGQGTSVALSADGNTALVGASADTLYRGSAWVFVRSGGIWTQQGSKLSITGFSGKPYAGVVALSGDGNTAVIGGSGDSGSVGAAWIFTRSGTVWSQQGEKLVGSGAIDFASQGSSVSLSGDGNTVMIGGSTDNYLKGAVWVFTRSGGMWSQQGQKLVPTDGIYQILFGASVSLSEDGNTVLIGGSFDDGEKGACWIFKRSGDVWTQYGAKLVGTGGAYNARQGSSVSLSAHGTTGIIGGWLDDTRKGSAWVFVDKTLVAAIRDRESGTPIGTRGIVHLYDTDGKEVDARNTDSLSAATFHGTPLGSGFSYTVHVASGDPSALFDTTYWGRRSGIVLTSGPSATDTFVRNAPYAVKVEAFDPRTNLPVAGDTVYAGIPVRIDLTVKNPDVPGAATADVRTKVFVNADGTAGYESVLASSVRTLSRNTTAVISVLLTPLAAGDYYCATAVLTAIEGNEIPTDAMEDRAKPFFSVKMPPLPAVPLAASPADGVVDQPVSVRLAWHPVAMSTTYHLQVSTDSSFAGGLVWNDSTLTDTVCVVSGLAHQTVYYWRVQSVNITGASSYSATRRFRTIVDTPATVELMSPPHGALHMSSTVSLRWHSAPLASTFHVVVATDSQFVGGIALSDSAVADTSRLVSGLQYAKTYYWHVRGKNVAGAGQWSSRWSFRTLDADPSIPGLIAPAHMATGIDTPVTLRWSRPGGATSFRIQVARDSLFTAGLIVTDMSVPDTSALLHSLNLLTAYWWHVNATHPVNGTSAYSVVRRFSTGLVQPGKVVLLEPAHNMTVNADTLRFRWRATAPFVDRYWLEYGVDSSFTVKGIDSTLTDTTAVIRSMIKSIDYYWRVRGHNALGWGAFSERWRFFRSLVAVEGRFVGAPERYDLSQNYPNPFNPATRIAYGLPASVHVRLTVMNTLGQEVATLVDANQETGFHEVTFDGKNLSSGLYFYRLHAGDFVATRRLLLIR